VEVKLFGRADKTAYGKLTASVTELLNRELGISPGQIYVQYEETAHWGWNGSNL
jgi:phenylpyruvate tautomerase PptA (4-oxalocrotonate tautomerase family)